MHRLRFLVPPAGVGAAIGLALAGREVFRQEYLAQGLWRTSFWTAGHGAVGGLLVGAGAGLVLALLAWLWPRAAAKCSALDLLGRFVSRWVGRRLARLIMGRPGMALSAVLLAATIALWAAGDIAVWKARAGARGLNVILIGIDTMRADRASLVSADEHDRDLTPKLRERLAVRGTVFANAITQAPWTLPAFASIFTGLYPEQHGAEHLTSTLPPDRLTLTEILREAGYRTFGVVSCEYLNRASGMGQGFDVLDESQVLGHRAITSGEVTTRALDILERNKKEPFFLFVHYFDPHFNYRDHEDYHFADRYDGPLRSAAENADQNAFRWLIGTLGPDFRGARRLSAEDLRYLNDCYDEEIAYTDAQIGRLLAYLDEADLWDSTLVIAVSDHGEELVDRNWCGHAITLYQELVRVPLVIAVPGGSQRSVDTRAVEARALFGTILDFVGFTAVSEGGYPESMLTRSPPGEEWLRSSTRPVAEAPERGTFVPKHVWLSCVTDGRWKFVKDHLRGRATLFDLENDPGETWDCTAENPERRRELEHRLEELDAEVLAGAPSKPAPQISDEQMRRLKSLGYL